MTPKKKPDLNPDFFLTAVASQLAENYAKWPKQLVGSRVFFEIGPKGQRPAPEVRTIAFEEERPRLFAGYQVPERSDYYFLRIALTRVQLAEFFTGRLDLHKPENDNVVFEGNSEDLYRAVGECLA
jgi:hypothetical protein